MPLAISGTVGEMGSTSPFTDMLDGMIRAEHHRRSMEVCMWANQWLKGAPYGPTLNEVIRPEVLGIRSITDQ